MQDSSLRDFAGDIIQPGDAVYDQASGTPLHEGAPALILRPQTPQDVARAITYGTGHGLTISARSGGA